MTTLAVKERPILFSGPMVRAILAGRKTVTRRVMKQQPTVEPGIVDDGKLGLLAHWPGESEFDVQACHCPYGRPGDVLWVRETWAPMQGFRPIPNPEKYDSKPAWYKADNDRPMWAGTTWRPSIFMPREACRIKLEITDVTAERLMDIAEEECEAEGLEGGCLSCGSEHCRCDNPQPCFKDSFIFLWNKLNQKRGYGWRTNPYVWVVSFKRIKP